MRCFCQGLVFASIQGMSRSRNALLLSVSRLCFNPMDLKVLKCVASVEVSYLLQSKGSQGVEMRCFYQCLVFASIQEISRCRNALLLSRSRICFNPTDLKVSKCVASVKVLSLLQSKGSPGVEMRCLGRGLVIASIQGISRCRNALFLSRSRICFNPRDLKVSKCVVSIEVSYLLQSKGSQGVEMRCFCRGLVFASIQWISMCRNALLLSMSRICFNPRNLQVSKCVASVEVSSSLQFKGSPGVEMRFSVEVSSLLQSKGSPGVDQGQLLEGVECHIYLYCFTFVDINLNRVFVIIVLIPK